MALLKYLRIDEASKPESLKKRNFDSLLQVCHIVKLHVSCHMFLQKFVLSTFDHELGMLSVKK